MAGVWVPTIHGYDSCSQAILAMDIPLLLLVGLCGRVGRAPKSGWAADVQTRDVCPGKPDMGNRRE